MLVEGFASGSTEVVTTSDGLLPRSRRGVESGSRSSIFLMGSSRGGQARTMNHFMNGLGVMLSSFVFACGPGALDGGSNASSGSPANPILPGSSGSSGEAQDGIATGPIAGTVVGTAFEPTAFELRPDTKSSRWTLQIHNASASCAKGRRLGEDVVIVTVESLGGLGSWPVDPGDGHFQRGFFKTEDMRAPATDTSEQGRVRIEAAPEAPGTTVANVLRHAARDHLKPLRWTTYHSPRQEISEVTSRLFSLPSTS